MAASSFTNLVLLMVSTRKTVIVPIKAAPIIRKGEDKSLVIKKCQYYT